MLKAAPEAEEEPQMNRATCRSEEHQHNKGGGKDSSHFKTFKKIIDDCTTDGTREYNILRHLILHSKYIIFFESRS